MVFSIVARRFIILMKNRIDAVKKPWSEGGSSSKSCSNEFHNDCKDEYVMFELIND